MKLITYVVLSPVNFYDLTEVLRGGTRVSLTITRSLHATREVVRSLVRTKNLVALVVDLFGTDAFDIAVGFNVSPYILFPSTTMLLSLFLFLPQLEKTATYEYKDLQELVKIPGCIPIHGKDLLDPLQDRKNDAYKWTLHHAKRYALAEGIMVNTFTELGPGPLKSLQKLGKPRVYPIGPFTRMGTSRSDNEAVAGSDCLKWLDDQPLRSVLCWN